MSVELLEYKKIICAMWQNSGFSLTIHINENPEKINIL